MIVKDLLLKSRLSSKIHITLLLDWEPNWRTINSISQTSSKTSSSWLNQPCVIVIRPPELSVLEGRFLVMEKWPQKKMSRSGTWLSKLKLTTYKPQLISAMLSSKLLSNCKRMLRSAVIDSKLRSIISEKCLSLEMSNWNTSLRTWRRNWTQLDALTTVPNCLEPLWLLVLHAIGIMIPRKNIWTLELILEKNKLSSKQSVREWITSMTFLELPILSSKKQQA